MTVRPGLKEVQRLLTSRGFTKHSGNVYIRDTNAGFAGWLGLNIGTKHRNPGEFSINPVIGVVSYEIERLLGKYLDEEPSLNPSISSPLGYLMPAARYRMWEFQKDSLSTAQQMVEAILAYGVPFMEDNSNVESVCNLLERGKSPTMLEFRRPIALALTGRAEDALGLIDEELAGMTARTDAHAVLYRNFALAFKMAES